MCSHIVYGHTRALSRAAEGVLLAAAATALRVARAARALRARVVPSGFSHSHDTYNGIGVERESGDVCVTCRVSAQRARCTARTATAFRTHATLQRCSAASPRAHIH